MFYADLDILVVGIGVQKPIAFFLGNVVDGLRSRFAATHLPARREDTGRVLLKSLLKGRRAPECLRLPSVRVGRSGKSKRVQHLMAIGGHVYSLGQNADEQECREPHNTHSYLPKPLLLTEPGPNRLK